VAEVKPPGADVDIEGVDAPLVPLRRLGELLVARDLLTVDQLATALKVQAQTGERLGAILIDQRFVSARDLTKALMEQLGMELIEGGARRICPDGSTGGRAPEPAEPEVVAVRPEGAERETATGCVAPRSPTPRAMAAEAAHGLSLLDQELEELKNSLATAAPELADLQARHEVARHFGIGESCLGQRSGRTLVLYSHDTYGLGHLRRNVAIAHALRERDRALNIVLLSGSSVAEWLPMPAGVAVVQLPSVLKVGPDEYRPVEPSRSLRRLRAQRRDLIASTLLRVRPDLVLVDHAPLGMKGELALALTLARTCLPATRVVLGLRDILDDPAVVRRVWREQGVYEALELFYDQILVYGSQALFDVVAEYEFPQAVRGRTRFTGYIAKDVSLETPLGQHEAWTSIAPGACRVLVMGGGGGDAEALFSLFLRAWPAVRSEVRAHALLVTGPLMDDAVRRMVVQVAGEAAGVTVSAFSPSMLGLIARANLVVSMGGYNSLTEVVAAGKPLVCCPRVSPRTEQLMRAQILERLGLARIVRLDSNSDELAASMLEALASPDRRLAGAIDLGGSDRVADALLGTDAGCAVGLAREVSV
jgi:predicted glycosyltransferase